MDDKKSQPTMQQPAAEKPSPVAKPPLHAAVAPVRGGPGFTKPPPADLYRRLLPAALFLLTFVTVMTMLLMYMDTTALRAQQFRVNMTRDYDLRRIAQDDPFFVAYVRQLHLSVGTKPLPLEDENEAPTPRIQTLLEAVNNKYNGTFVELLVSGSRDAGAEWLERRRGWRGLVVRADPRDSLSLRSAAAHTTHTLHACLSPVSHPKEVTYYESAGRRDGVTMDAPDGYGFSSRVLCFPLYTVLLVGNATRCDYLLLSSPYALKALHTLPFHRVSIQVIEVRMEAGSERNSKTELLRGKGYEVRAEFDDGVLYERVRDTAAEV